MSTFHMENQRVNNQYVAGRDINFGAVQSREELVGELGKVRAELDRADAAGDLDKGVVTDAKHQLEKAVQQAEKPEPDKDTVVKHLTAARDVVKEISALGGVATGLAQAIEKVGALF